MPRKSVPRQIADYANRGEWVKADEMAKYGRDLSVSESFFRHFYNAQDELEAGMKGKQMTALLKTLYAPPTTEQLEEMKSTVKRRREELTAIFLEAVDTHDWKMIIELAKGVRFFKDKRYPNFVPVDPLRARLLFIRSIIEDTGEKLTIRQIARLISLERMAGGKKWEFSEDGFSALRRKCKELHIPLAESRKQRRK